MKWEDRRVKIDIEWSVTGSTLRTRISKPWTIKWQSIHIYQQLNLKTKINKQAKQKQTHKYREHFDDCHLGGRSGGWVKKVKGLRDTNW